MEVGKRTIRDVGAARFSLRRAFIARIRAVREDGLDLRIRNARLLGVDAAFLTRRWTPTGEKDEALANRASPSSESGSYSLVGGMSTTSSPSSAAPEGSARASGSRSG